MQAITKKQTNKKNDKVLSEESTAETSMPAKPPSRPYTRRGVDGELHFTFQFVEQNKCSPLLGVDWPLHISHYDTTY